MMRSAFLLTALMIMSVFVSSTAYACSCAQQTPEQYLTAAASVFEGVVIATVEAPADCKDTCRRKHTFRISRAWKGEAMKQEQIDIWTEPEGSLCGANFEEGKGYVVFAEVRPEGLFAHLCGGSTPEKYSAPMLAVLGAGVTPVHPTVPDEDAPVAIPTEDNEPEQSPAIEKTKAPPGGCRGCATTKNGSAQGFGLLLLSGFVLFRRRSF